MPEEQTLLLTCSAIMLQMESEEDQLWQPDVRESTEDLTRRGVAFLQWIMQRPERGIAIVTHSSFLLHMLSTCGDQAAPNVQVR